MNYTSSIIFFSAIAVATFMACGVFFYKFYRTSHDNFYLMFALACFMMSIERVLILSFIGPLPTEATPWLYVIRLMAFLLIFFAIYNKNKSQRRS